MQKKNSMKKTNLPEFLILKILPLSYHPSHFWATTLDFTTFSYYLFLHGLHLFLQHGCFCVDFPYMVAFYFITYLSWILFFFPLGRIICYAQSIFPAIFNVFLLVVCVILAETLDFSFTKNRSRNATKVGISFISLQFHTQLISNYQKALL